MPTALIVLNALLAVTVVAGIVGLLAWSIATEGRDHVSPPTRAGHDPLVTARPSCGRNFDPSFDAGVSVGLVRSFPRAES